MANLPLSQVTFEKKPDVDPGISEAHGHAKPRYCTIAYHSIYYYVHAVHIRTALQYHRKANSI